MKRSRSFATATPVKKPFLRKSAPKYPKYRALRQGQKNTTTLGLGFPRQVTVTQKYKEVIDWSGGAGGAMQVYQFSANGLYDPNITGTGHQPMFFDQLGALYDHYVVKASRYKVTVQNRGSTFVKLGLFLNDDSSVTPASPEAVAEQASGKFYLLDQSGTEKGRAYLTCGYDAAATFGPGILANNVLEGTPAANPSESAVFTLVAQAWDLSTAWTVILDVTVEYDVIWKENKDIISS